MRFGEVDDVDEVSLAGTVWGRVVIAEDGEAFADADGCLGDERDEIVRDPARKFSDKGGRMCADWIEVAQGYAADL